MTSFIQKLLTISQTYSYMKPILDQRNTLSHFNYGPLGELLCHNIRNEWINSCVFYRDHAVFPFHYSNVPDDMIFGIKEQFLEVKNICQNNLPFGITFTKYNKTRTVEISNTEESKYFRPANCTELKCVTFTTPDEGRQFFHFWQRQRNIWWRKVNMVLNESEIYLLVNKFSADPGRFSLTEIRNENDTEQTSIQAKFAWGIEPIETICFFSENIFENLTENEQQIWKFKLEKRKIFPCVIESTTNLDLAAFCFLCDAFREEIRLDTDLSRQFVKLHRKLAPYKTAFAIDSKGTSQEEEMKLLTEYLALNLKKAGVSTLFVPNITYNSLEELFQRYDLMGIPYVIVVKASTLIDGIFGLRSRETTLQEQLHIDLLSSHLEKLLKHY